MVRTRWRSMLWALALLVGVPGSTAAQAEPLDFREAPFVIFAPAPPKPAAIAHYPIPDGAEDFWRLFEDDSLWSDALEHVDAFAMHAWMFRYSTTDQQLRTLFDWLDVHQVPFGLEVEPLTWPGPEVCDHGESFEGPYDLEQIRRIRDLGGRIDFISFDEPYSHAYRWDGPRACRYTLEQTVDEAWAFVQDLRTLFPTAQVGSIEPMWSDPLIGADDMALWLDTWAERTGEPFAFLNLDIDWRREGWPEVVREVQAVADARDVPLGMLYLGSQFSRDNDEWLEQLATHTAILETGYGVRPDIVGFYSWHDVPDRLLPDDDLNAFTGRINQYFGTRTQLEPPSMQGRQASGRLLDSEGTPLAAQELTVTAKAIDRDRSRHRLSGTVPQGARQALIAVRANVEGGDPAPVDVRISDVSYREGKGRNKVPNARFGAGLRRWGAYGTGAVAIGKNGAEAFMRLRAKPTQTIFVDGDRFKVKPGASFDFAATIDVPGKSMGSGYVSLIFIADQEVARENLWFSPRPRSLAPVVTDAQGRYRIGLGDLRPGRYELVVLYPGDLDHRLALGSGRVRVK